MDMEKVVRWRERENITQPSKNEILPFAVTQYDKVQIHLSEVNQTKENKYYMILLIHRI